MKLRISEIVLYIIIYLYFRDELYFDLTDAKAIMTMVLVSGGMMSQCKLIAVTNNINTILMNL